MQVTPRVPLFFLLRAQSSTFLTLNDDPCQLPGTNVSAANFLCLSRVILIICALEVVNLQLYLRASQTLWGDQKLRPHVTTSASSNRNFLVEVKGLNELRAGSRGKFYIRPKYIVKDDAYKGNGNIVVCKTSMGQT